MDFKIREPILGHADKIRAVYECYGRIGNQELLNAIDSMTFDHGPDKIIAPEMPKNVDSVAT